VAIAERRVTAQNILVATGGRPSKPSIRGIEHGDHVERGLRSAA